MSDAGVETDVQSPTQVTLRRADRPGDLGWVVQANAELYARQFGWDTSYETLVLRIVADFAADHDPATETGWIAELDGRRVGCIFCVAAGSTGVAKLRLLLVDPVARHHGIGRRLVAECLAFARAAGYRRMELWTNDVLAAARRIYEAEGFELIDSERHHSFGDYLVGQNWGLDL